MIGHKIRQISLQQKRAHVAWANTKKGPKIVCMTFGRLRHKSTRAFLPAGAALAILYYKIKSKRPSRPLLSRISAAIRHVRADMHREKSRQLRVKVVRERGALHAHVCRTI